MSFRVLGPLEWVDRGTPVQLGGMKQRSTLAFLLLHSNRVVATSKLVDALWTGEEAPASARKVLQNAVWGLRGILATTAGDPSSSVVLQTKAPGYILCADPDQIDLFRFRRLVGEGQAELAAGATEKAARLLREALALWRGPALADLVEAGVSWSELALIQNAKYAAMEDRFEAELSCGGHYTVLADLEALVEAEPFRERACAQLMLAFYRCGRQADALNVYARIRATLVDELGLEPGRELQQLQQAILAQSPTLVLPGRVAPQPVLVDGPRTRAALSATTQLLDEQARPRPVPASAMWEQATAVVFCTEVGSGSLDPSHVDDVLDDVASAISQETERFGGTVIASIGEFSLALFSADGKHDAAERAVRAALGVRGSIKASGYRCPLRTAAATGETLVRSWDDLAGLSAVNGTLVVKCQALLAFAEPGDILVCDNTRAATTMTVSYARSADPAGGWRVLARRARLGSLIAQASGHDPELDVLESLLDWVIQRDQPHLVSVLGGPDSGKTRFLAAFEARVSAAGEKGPLVVRMPPFAGAWGLRACILSACCGIVPGDSPKTTREKLDYTVRYWCSDKGRVAQTVEILSLFLEPGDNGYRIQGREAAALEWSALVSRIAMERPVVVFIDDLHATDEALLDFIEGLADSVAAVPVMVIAAARPELLERRADWGGGKLQMTTMTLDARQERKLPSAAR